MTFRALATMWTAFVSAVFLLVFSSGCERKGEARGPVGPVTVTTQVLSSQEEAGRIEAAGTVRAGREATLAGKIMGTVIEIRKDAGESVKRGEILIVIDSRDVSGQIAQAQGALAQAKAAAALAEANFHRFEQLRARGAASGLELDQARYQHDTARGAVQQAEGAVAAAGSYSSYAEIAAPFSGRLVDRLCEVGDLATPGRPLLRIEDTESLRLYASLDASKGGAGAIGARAEVRVPALGDRLFEGRVTELVPAADPATHTLLVKIDLPADPALRSGLFGRAFLPLGNRESLRVPRAAVVHRGGIAGVFAVENGHALFHMVVLSEDRPEMPRVLSGLSTGDAVILNPPVDLEVGSPVEVRS